MIRALRDHEACFLLSPWFEFSVSEDRYSIFEFLWQEIEMLMWKSVRTGNIASVNLSSIWQTFYWYSSKCKPRGNNCTMILKPDADLIRRYTKAIGVKLSRLSCYIPNENGLKQLNLLPCSEKLNLQSNFACSSCNIPMLERHETSLQLGVQASRRKKPNVHQDMRMRWDFFNGCYTKLIQQSARIYKFA